MAKKTPTKNKPVFGALILTHGRAENVVTFETLRKFGYTGPIRLVVDNEDKTVDLYREKFGAYVIVFDKKAVSETFDEGDNFEDRRAIIYARNASFEIAKELGWTHFIQLDDDYVDWRWCFGSDRRYHHPTVVSLDRVFAALVRFLDSTPTLTIALAQAGDLIGGQSSGNLEAIDLGRKGKRKAMNTFVCRVDRPIGFVGRINEDVNTYVRKGAVGDLFFATNCARVTQLQTQTNGGGMTDLYRDSGTYVKSFYTVLYAPSCVRVQPLTTKFPRWHHRIDWRHAVPKILREEHRRAR